MTKHAIVTGAAGLLGSHVTSAFRSRGYTVTALDVTGAPGVDEVDLTKLDAAMEAIGPADCMAHIASLPRPVGYEAEDVFRINMTLMFNVLTAMERSGIEKMVFASSFSVLGLPFAPKPVEIGYFPVDEHHPQAPQDVYAVTKWLGEEMVEAWTRRTGHSAASIRMPWIQTAKSFPEQVGPRRDREEAGLDLWAYIDARDAGRAFVQAAEADIAGHERFFISAADTYSERETASLLDETYPAVERRTPLPGHTTLLSNDRAAELIGYAPEYGWRDY
jgi:nucleoside-diphosphate-sugar epimerase